MNDAFIYQVKIYKYTTLFCHNEISSDSTIL